MSITPEILWPALRQYRHNIDNSPDIYNPAQGFVAAFDHDLVVTLVRDYEARIKNLTAALAESSIMVMARDRRIKELEAAITDVLEGKVFDEHGNREGGGLSEYPYDKPAAKLWMVEHLRAVQEPGQ